VALTAAAVLAAVIATTAADHGTSRVPPAGGSSATPLSNQGATHGTPTRRPDATHPAAEAHTPPPKHVAKSAAPVSGHGKGKQKGKGKSGPGH
jgi:hypothetical protein